MVADLEHLFSPQWQHVSTRTASLCWWYRCLKALSWVVLPVLKMGTWEFLIQKLVVKTKETMLRRTASILKPRVFSYANSRKLATNSVDPIDISPSAVSVDPIHVDVTAYYLARGLNTRAILNNQTDSGLSVYKGLSRSFDKKSVTITLDVEKNEYISIFHYGSVVIFNIPKEDHTYHLDLIKEHALQSPLSPNDNVLEDHYKLQLQSDLQGLPKIFKADHLKLKNLDNHSISIIATVLAQTVSLDYYADLVDNMLNSFMAMNINVEHLKGNQKAIEMLDKQKLYRLVAQNNTVITNVLSKLGIFEGSDAAWESQDYHYTWEALRQEFELDYRFKDLSLKLDIVKDNATFFISMLNTEKSEKLEWIIIVLIAAEVVLGITTLYVEHVGDKTTKILNAEQTESLKQEMRLLRGEN